MKVIKIAHVPPPSVSADASVLESVRTMQGAKSGACVVLDNNKLVGIFSERDLMLRVVAAGLDPDKTAVREVMTTRLETLTTEAESSEALDLMVSRHIRHLPIVEKDGSLAGLLSVLSLFRDQVEDLGDQLNSLEAYFTADGPGG
ncbi:MAG: CBS domain-containing protein [Deltaproteobacteria bacterium]|nr:CBS domain-containing protein [Deltaproteobacteria bacterium]